MMTVIRDASLMSSFTTLTSQTTTSQLIDSRNSSQNVLVLNLLMSGSDAWPPTPGPPDEQTPTAARCPALLAVPALTGRCPRAGGARATPARSPGGPAVRAHGGVGLRRAGAGDGAGDAARRLLRGVAEGGRRGARAALRG